jgi:Holliday junction resolvase RusA-like endonuclease
LQGRRYKTDDYESYEIEVSALLPYDIKHTAVDGELYEITYRFYLRYHATTDYDNLLKPLQDILVANGVLTDDRFIYKAHQEKIPSDVDRIEVVIEPFSLPDAV